jgi:predicted amidohydrolase/ribosomal protein S18 acetylase RimI-like enzyme
MVTSKTGTTTGRKTTARKPATKAVTRSKKQRDERLVLRRMRLSDLKGIRQLQERCFPGVAPWSEEHIRSHLRVFPQGQLVVEIDGKIVATSSSLIVEGATFEDPHTFKQVSGGGMLTTHDPEGDMLYGIDIAVDPSFRGMRLARRIYDERKRLVVEKNLRGIMFGGRAPRYHKHAPTMSFSEYVTGVVAKELRDPTITAQLSNGFSIRRTLPGYLPSDAESLGYAVLMEWLNPSYAPRGDRSLAQSVRVASVQYQLRPIQSFEEFCSQCEFYMDTAAEYRCDFLVYPELLTTQLQVLFGKERPGVSARRLDEFTERYLEFFSQAAIRYNVNIIGGTHLILENDRLYNASYLFRRDGSMDRQLKLHITPAEQHWWGVSPGDDFRVFETDRGPVAILICYDVEFPELGRLAANLGARIFFVPYNTDLRQAHMRVRSCAIARCIENHVYCVTSGAVGNLPFVEGADIHYAESAVLTPCDIPFPRDGVATAATPNVEAMLIHDLDMATLRRNRRTGAVRPWHDRRTDLYRVEFGEGKAARKV